MIGDFHVHTDFSGDSITPLFEMIEKGISLGLERICITDHMDYMYPEEGDFTFDPEIYWRTVEDAKQAYKGKIKVYTGIELGLRNEQDVKSGAKEYYDSLMKAYDYDFVIGSTHALEYKDPYNNRYWDDKTNEEGMTAYFRSIIDNTKMYDCFLVYGHLDYIVRYIKDDIKDYNYADYKDLLDEALKTLIAKGKGIELNTAGWKYGLTFAHPKQELLCRYRELGGEIITLGSDAHEARHLAYDFNKADELLKSCGFDYITVFEKKIPTFIKL